MEFRAGGAENQNEGENTMKNATSVWSRMLSMLLAPCMVLSIVAEPCSLLITPVKGESEAASLISTPVYSHTMDTLEQEKNNARKNRLFPM